MEPIVFVSWNYFEGFFCTEWDGLIWVLGVGKGQKAFDWIAEMSVGADETTILILLQINGVFPDVQSLKIMCDDFR